MSGTCTFNGTSSVQIRLTAEDNNAVIRCAVEQELATSDMFRESQPDYLVVYYQVKNIQITKSPNLPNFAGGASDITLTCSSEGNPTPAYTWHKDTDVNTTLATGKTFRLQQSDVIVNNTGNYVCVAHNSFNGKDHELTATEHIQIDYTTTAPTTIPSTTTTYPTATKGPQITDNKGIEALTITSFVATGDTVLGPSNVQLSCSYIPTTGDTIFVISLQAKLSGTFKNIATFYTPNIPNEASLGTDGLYLESRVSLTNPTSSAANVEAHAVMTFNETECEDETEYKCIVSYNGPGGVQNPEMTRNIVVKGKPALPDNDPRWLPKSGIEDGTDVTFTCTGNIGRPAGKFKWTKYKGTSPTEYHSATTTAVAMPGTCTFIGTGTVTIRLTAEDNNAVIKCAVEQELATSDMFRQSQPDDLVVYYQIRNIQITKLPNLPNFAERASDITVTCSAEGNPTPTYTWYRDTDVNTTLSTGNTLTLQKHDVIVCNTGNYVCVAHNSFNGKSHKLTHMERIKIVYNPGVTTANNTDSSQTRPGSASDNSGLVGGIIFVCLLQVGELLVVIILYRKGIVVFRLKKEKVYEDASNKRPDNHVYSTMTSSTGENAHSDERYYNL